MKQAVITRLNEGFLVETRVNYDDVFKQVYASRQLEDCLVFINKFMQPDLKRVDTDIDTNRTYKTQEDNKEIIWAQLIGKELI